MEQGEAFLNGTVTVGAFCARLCGCAFLRRNLLAGLLVDIGFPFFYKTDGEVVELVKIVGGMVYAAPFETEPFDVLFDGFNVFGIFFLRVGVVEAEIANAAEFLRYAKVHADGFGMTYVEIAVGFRWETGLKSSSVFAFLKVGLYDLFDEIQALLF